MSKTQCPLLKKPCIEHRCTWYVHLFGSDPQTGEQLNKFGCSIAFLPILLIENAKEVRQTAGAVESARNEQVNNAALLASTLLRAQASKDVTPALEHRE